MLRLTKFIVLFLLAACSGQGDGTDENRAQREKENSKREREIDVITGTYSGRLEFSASTRAPESGKLHVYKVFVQDGVDPDGSLRMRPELKARFHLDNFIMDSDDLIMTGDYNGLTGKMSLTSLGGRTSSMMMSTADASASGPVTKSEIWISGTSNGQNVDLAVSNENGVWGKFKGSLEKKEVATGASGSVGDERDRRLRIFNQVIGTYNGEMSYKHPDMKNFLCLDFNLVLTETETNLGLMPSLFGFFGYTRLKRHSASRPMQIRWDSLTNEISIYSAPQSSPGGPSFPPMVLRGKLKGGVLEYEASDFRGVFARVRAKKDFDPPTCEKERKVYNNEPSPK